MVDVTIILFIYLFGLCVGSFLNVVIYRLPRGLSVATPLWSFCPHCRATLKWYDNVPVLSWLMLRARCRYCGQAISAQYPMIEAITGLVFVLAYYLLFVIETRVSHIGQLGAVTLAPAWPADAGLLLAWLVLASVLVACSAMDLIFYVIDTRVTDVALAAGIVCHACWPAPASYVERAADPTAAAALAAFVISAVMIWLSNRKQAEAAEEESPAVSDTADSQDVPASIAEVIASRAAVILFVGLAVWMIVGSAYFESSNPAFQYLVPIALAALFIAMVLTGGQPRAIDEELHAAIEAEAPEARRLVLGELCWLTPALCGALLAYFLVRNVPAVEQCWTALVHWTPIGRLTPLGGVAFSIHGAIVAATAGWFIRIFFTLAFGREAFGVGDIFILAAAGAAGGWDIALFGFVLSVPIALAGWIISLVLKRTGMIPFGPPLAIGFLTALWVNPHASDFADRYARILTDAWRHRPEVVYLAVGMLLVVLPVSIVLARFTRRLVEPDGR